MNLCNITKTFEDYKLKGWDRIFVLVDAHGTIIPSGKHDSFSFVNPECAEVLRWFSQRSEVRLILWTSSYEQEINDLRFWLLSHGIVMDYANQNPEAKDTDRACFARKPYYNIVIDDRASFNPEYGWLLIARELEIITGEGVLEWTVHRKKQLRDCAQYLKNDLDNLIIFDEVVDSP